MNTPQKCYICGKDIPEEEDCASGVTKKDIIPMSKN